MKTTIVLRHHAAAADEAPEPGVVPTHHTDLARRRTLLAKLQRCTALVQFMVQGAFRALAIQCTLEFEDWYSGNAPMEASVDGGSGDGSGAGDEQGDNSSPPGDAAFGTASPAAPAFAKLLAAARPRPLLVVNVDVVSDATGCLLATSPALASQLEMVKLLQMALLFALKSAPELKFRPDTLSAPLNLLGNDSEPAKWLEHTMVSVPRLDLLLALKHDADAFYGEAPALAHSHAWIAETTWVVGVFADAGFIKATRQCGRVVRSESLRVAGMLRKYEKTLKLHSVVQEWTLSMSVSKPSTVQALLQRFSDETLPLGAAFRVDREAWLCQNEKGFDTAANRMHWLHDNVLKKHRAETLEMADSVVSADDALVDAAGAAKARKGSSHVVLKAARARLVGAADAALGCAHAFMPSLFGVQAVELVIDLSAKNEHLASGAATLDEFLEQLAQLRDLGAGWEALEKRVEDVAALHEKVVLLQLTSSHSPAIHKEAYAAVFVALDPAAQGHAQLQLLKKKLAGALSKALAVDADAAQRAADAASGPPRVQRTGSASSVKVKLARVSSGLSLSAPPPPLQRVLSTPRRRRDSDGSVSFSEEPLMCLETHLAEAVAEAWAQLQTALNSTLLHAMKRRNIFRNEMYERAKLIARDVSAVRDGADSPLLVHASTAPATALAALAKWSVKHADVTVRALALREAQTLFNSHFSAASASSKCRDKPYQAPTFLEDLVLTVSIENGGSSAVDDSLANQLVDLFSLSDTRFAQRRLDLQTQHWACLETLGEAVAAWKLAKLDSDFSAGKPHNILLAAADAAQGVWLALGGADRASVSAPVSPGSPGSPSRAAFFSNARKASYGSSSAVTNAPLSAPPRDDDDADDATARTANTCESLKTSASEVALREYSSMNPGLEQRLKSEIAAARALAAHALPLTAEFMGLEARSLSHWVGLAKLLPALTAGIETSSASLSLTLEELAIKGRLAVGALDADLAKRPRQIAEAVYNGRMQHFLQVLGASVLETWSEADEFSSQAMIAAGFAVADAPASVPHREILAILQGALAAPRGRLRQACRACLKAVERSIEERTLPKPPAAVPAAVALAAEAFVAERHAEWRSRCDAGEALLNEVATLVAEAALLRSLRVSSGPQSAVPQAVATALEAAVSALRSGLDELRGVDKLGIFLGDEDDAQRSLQLATFEFAKAKDGFEGTRTLLRDFLEDQTVEDWLERQRLKNEPSVPADAAAAADAADGAARPAPPLQARLGDALSFANFGPALDAGAPHEVALDTGEA
ncbi:hypothetical protein M885DRAFT_530430 [Pelagophyceae sp. CCMP2097]|nr:hypothetical protein M885DRAFT_530430 [Pelagophyceae sp. CCMP2097]